MPNIYLTSLGPPKPETMADICKDALRPKAGIVMHGYDLRPIGYRHKVLEKRVKAFSDQKLAAAQLDLYPEYIRTWPLKDRRGLMTCAEQQARVAESLSELGVIYLAGGDIASAISYRRILRDSGLEQHLKTARNVTVIGESLGAVMRGVSLDGIHILGQASDCEEGLREGMGLVNVRPVPHANWSFQRYTGYIDYMKAAYPADILKIADGEEYCYPY